MTMIVTNDDIYVDVPILTEEHVTVTATVYQATASQCNEDYLTTAFGYKIDPTEQLHHRYIAVSRDLEQYFSKGDSVLISGTGIYDGMWMIADRMHYRWCNRIDLLINEDSPLGKFENIIVTKQQ
jgi:3D (Asp-Asp-Asp) domain-containing protein